MFLAYFLNDIRANRNNNNEAESESNTQRSPEVWRAAQHRDVHDTGQPKDCGSLSRPARQASTADSRLLSLSLQPPPYTTHTHKLSTPVNHSSTY